MIEPETENGNPALEEASRELQAARHDAQVAYDCIALGDIDRAHTHALTAKIAADAAVTALAAALGLPDGSSVTLARWTTRSYRLRRGSMPGTGRVRLPAGHGGRVRRYRRSRRSSGDSAPRSPGARACAWRRCTVAGYRMIRPSRSSWRPRASEAGSPRRPASRRVAATRPANATRW